MTSPKTTCSNVILVHYVIKVVLLVGAVVSFHTKQSMAQVETLTLGTDNNGDEIPVPTNLYVGDENALTIYPGIRHNNAQLRSISWTWKTTAPSGQTQTGTVDGQQQWSVGFGQLGTYELTANFTYYNYIGNTDPNSVKVTITVSPPSGVVFLTGQDDAGNQINPDPNTIYNINGGGSYYYFHIIGGSTNNGYSMIVEEAISFDVPVGKAPPFVGWGWYQGPNVGDPVNNTPYLTMSVAGLIQDLKSMDNSYNDNTIANGSPIMKYHQKIGVKVQNMDQTISDITLGTFTFKAIRVSPTQFTISITPE